MRTTRLLGATALFLAAACKPLPPKGSVAVDLARALPRPVLQLDASAPDIYLSASVAAGSAFDPLGNEGLAALTAHTMISGGAGDRDPDGVRQALFLTGNDLQVVVDKEQVTFRLRCHRDQADLCIDLFADVLAAPRFDESEVGNAREEAVYTVTDGLRSDEEALAYDVLDAWLFEGHPYGHPVDGRSGALPLLDAAACRAFHDRMYVRAATVIGVAGAATTAQVDHLMERTRGLGIELPTELALMAPIGVKGRSLLFVETGTDVVGFRMGVPLDLHRDDADWPALMLAFTAFGAHRQSFGTLFREVRGKRGLNYGTYAYVEPFVERRGAALPEQGTVRRQPFLHLWIRPTAPENAAFALKLTLAELADLAKDGLDQESFDLVKAYVLGSLPLLAPDPGRRLAYGVEATASGMPDPLTTLAAQIEALDLPTVNEALRRHVHPDDLRIVGVGGGGQAVVDALLADAPTPMVYAEGLEPDDAQRARDAAVAATSVGLTAATVSVRPVDDLFR